MKLTWLGHASFKIKTEDNVLIYIDPYADEYGYEEKADIVLVSHGAYDHSARDKIKKITGDYTRILTTKDNSGSINGEALDAGDEKFIENVFIRTTAMYNIGKDYHPVKGIGFLLTLEGKTIYFAGETDLIPEMKGIKADIALLPVCGTYAMNPREAVEAVEIIAPKIAIPMHYGDVVGTVDDALYFRELLVHNHDTDVIVMKEGQTLDL